MLLNGDAARVHADDAPQATPRDYRDLVIETLVDREATLLTQIAELEADIAWTRLCLRAAVNQLHRLARRVDAHDVELERLREHYEQMLASLTDDLLEAQNATRADSNAGCTANAETSAC